MGMIFKLIHPASLSVRVRSRECCIYLYRAMTFAGWTPPEQGLLRYLYLVWTFLYFTSSIIYVPLSLSLSLIIDYSNFTPGEFLSVLQVCGNRLHETQSLLDSLDLRLKNDSDRRKIHKAVAGSNFIFLVYAHLYWGYLVSDFIAGLVNAQPPWIMYNPLFNWRDGVGWLWLQSILEYIFMFNMAVVILIMDTYTTVFVNIFRAHIDVLKDHIRNLRTDPGQTEADNYQELVSCITYHKAILQCCDMMCPVMSRTICIQFLLIGVVLGLTMINVLYFAGIFRAVSSCLFLAAILVETFPFCYFCDMLAGDSTDLANLLGQSNWIDAEPKYKSALKIFMHHVQKPIVFIAGGFFPISLNSNIKMAKFAFTVMTIVQGMNLADRFK